MLTPEQVQEVLTSTEADRIERTRSTTNTTKFREAICAFSNDMPGHGKPGYLLIGVEDDGSLRLPMCPSQMISRSSLRPIATMGTSCLSL